MLGTSICTATGTGTNKQEEKTRNVEGGEEMDEEGEGRVQDGGELVSS